MAEWLGKGLQNPLRRFNSASDLKIVLLNNNGILISICDLICMPLQNKQNRKRKWTEDQLRKAVLESKSVRQVLKRLDLVEAGGNYAQIKKYIEVYKINKQHFVGQGWNKGLRGIGKPIMRLEDILVNNSNFQSFKLKKRLFAANLKPMHCEECGWKKFQKTGGFP
jgi:hypothetical protein